MALRPFGFVPYASTQERKKGESSMVEKIARDRRLRRRALPILGALALLVCVFAVWRESGRTRTAAMSQQEAGTYGVHLVTPPADVLP